jgi:PPOX class probable F420-dependent enzyme
VPSLPVAEARRRFAAARVARMATVTAEGRPHLVPCTFALDGDCVFVAVDHKPKTTTNLKRLRNIAANPSVALLTDRYDEDWQELWWVRADGQASVLEEPAAVSDLVGHLTEKYVNYADRPPAGPMIVINVTAWTGWSAS